MNNSEPWYAVRCLYEHPERVAKDGQAHLYEERVTLWKASSFKEAERKAEVEATKYAEAENCIFLRVSDTFHLFDEEIKEGAEAFSTMRESNMDADLYQRTFCCTPSDRAMNTPSLGIKNK